MNAFYDQFFNVEKFAHKELFEKDKPVWFALKNLSKYIKSLSLGDIEIDIPSNVTLVNPELISIGPGTIIEPGAYIEGPAVIGANCIIRHGAYVREDSLIGDYCIVGHASEIKHSVMIYKANAPHFNYVGDSILGCNTNLGAGFICANVRLDKGEIPVSIKKEKVNSGLKKFGAIIGDGSQFGCNGVSNPGSLFKKDSRSLPCKNVCGRLL